MPEQGFKTRALILFFLSLARSSFQLWRFFFLLGQFMVLLQPVFAPFPFFLRKVFVFCHALYWPILALTFPALSKDMFLPVSHVCLDIHRFCPDLWIPSVTVTPHSFPLYLAPQ